MLKFPYVSIMSYLELLPLPYAYGARARWKIENECFNSLKNHGYNIEHNYGHGSKNLCYNFYNFTLLAFTIHQIHQLVDKLFCPKSNFFESMEMLWEILAGKRDYRVPPI